MYFHTHLSVSDYYNRIKSHHASVLSSSMIFSCYKTIIIHNSTKKIQVYLVTIHTYSQEREREREQAVRILFRMCLINKV